MSLFEDDTSQQMMALAFFDPIYHDLNAVVLNYPIPSNSSEKYLSSYQANGTLTASLSTVHLTTIRCPPQSSRVCLESA